MSDLALTLDLWASEMGEAEQPRVSTIRTDRGHHIVFELEHDNRFAENSDGFPYWFAVDLGSVLAFCSRGVDVTPAAARAIAAALTDWADGRTSHSACTTLDGVHTPE